MILVKSKSYEELQTLIDKMVNFKSSCSFFPNFNITGKVKSISLNNNEIIFEVIAKPNDKLIKIGSNMTKLSYDII